MGEEEDGTLRPLCNGLFQSNLDTHIREFSAFADGGRWMLILVIAFLIGLSVLRNLHVLHHYGGRDGSPEPYVQIIQVRPWQSSDTYPMCHLLTYACFTIGDRYVPSSGGV